VVYGCVSLVRYAGESAQTPGLRFSAGPGAHGTPRLAKVQGGGTQISIVLGLFLVLLFVVVAVGGLILVQRLVPSTNRQEHNDVAGFIYAVLGLRMPCCSG
jgi:hypothetical protein